MVVGVGGVLKALSVGVRVDNTDVDFWRFSRLILLVSLSSHGSVATVIANGDGAVLSPQAGWEQRGTKQGPGYERELSHFLFSFNV